MKQQHEIQQANRKALPKFILIMILSMVIGGCVGFIAAKYGIGALPEEMKTAGQFFGIRIAPWLMLAIAVVLPVVSIPIYKRCKRLLADWDGEEERISDTVDDQLSFVIWLSGAALILSFFLIAAAYSQGFSILDEQSNLLSFALGIVGFFAILMEAVLIQQKCVDAAKAINPEKTASVYDMKFQKKWMDSCDEAEKALMGQCAFKAYRATGSLCGALATLLALGALLFGIGFLPSLMVCLIWIVSHTVYCREAMKLSKGGNFQSK